MATQATLDMVKERKLFEQFLADIASQVKRPLIYHRMGEGYIPEDVNIAWAAWHYSAKIRLSQ